MKATHSLTLLTALLTPLAAVSAAEPSLVPDTPSTAPDYFCTWNLQGFVSNYSGSNAQADAMTEANLFGTGPNQNWVKMFPDARTDLILVLDDTWDIPLAARDGDGRGHPKRGSLELDTQRFPSYTGTPAERFAKLNRYVRAHGWRSVGLWVYSGRPKKDADPRVNDEEYWAERMRWCRDTGIEYWKVDWGSYSEKELWRMNQWARWIYPGLWIEHGGGVKPTGERVRLADKLGVWRTYDVNPSAAVPETIRRVAVAISHPRENHDTAALINCEDEPYIGAGLGCVYGVMRHPLVGNMPNGKPDPWFRPQCRDLRRRLDEVTRAVRWHRIAQPFGITDKELVDTQGFQDSPKSAGVPARVARGGLPLPIVTGENPPYVLCSRHPDGEIAIATAPRKTRSGEVINPADITLDVGELNRPIGIFGKYGSLTLLTTSPLAGKRILAQDLAGQTPVDITGEVTLSDGRLMLPGAVIQRVGLMAAKPGDISDPGMLLVIEGLTKFIPKTPMKPFPGGERKLPAGKPGAGLNIVRAVWGPTYGGADVTAKMTAMIKDGGLTVEAWPEEFGDTSPSTHNRLEVEYTCHGQGHIAIALYGERLLVDAAGHYRTERSGRQRPDPFEDRANKDKISVARYGKPGSEQILTISKFQDLTRITVGDKRKNTLVVTGTASVISETEYAVTGFNQHNDREERVEVRTAQDGLVQLKRASLPIPEILNFRVPQPR